MKLIIVLSLLGLSLAELNIFNEFKEYSLDNSKTVTDYAIDLGLKDFAHQFNKFKIEHNRKYETQEEEEQRKFNFLKTLQFVEKHNQMYKKGDVSHEVGISLFADRYGEEYEQFLSAPIPLELTVTQSQRYYEGTSEYDSLPDSFDWREKGKVTPVKNQGDNCSSCWAFTTVALIESGYLIHNNQSLNLSEQQLVDCLNTECEAMRVTDGLDYAQNNGLEYEAEYPYQDKASACKNDPNKFHARFKSYQGLGKSVSPFPAEDQEIMAAIIRYGPVASMIDAWGYDYANYQKGVLTTGTNQWRATHVMTIIGWGTEHNTTYWIIKNSFGPTWGENGYLKLARGKNLRGINEFVYYLIF